MKRMRITEIDFVRILMGSVYAYAKEYHPKNPEMIFTKALLRFRVLCDENMKQRGYYHLSVKISEIPEVMQDILSGIPEFREEMSDYSDMCIETISDQFKEMALYDIMWDDYFDEMKSIEKTF